MKTSHCKSLDNSTQFTRVLLLSWTAAFPLGNFSLICYMHIYVCVCAFGDGDDDSGENEAHADQWLTVYFFLSIHHFYYCELQASSLSVPVTKHLIFSLKTSKQVHFSLWKKPISKEINEIHGNLTAVSCVNMQ